MRPKNGTGEHFALFCTLVCTLFCATLRRYYLNLTSLLALFSVTGEHATHVDLTLTSLFALTFCPRFAHVFARVAQARIA